MTMKLEAKARLHADDSYWKNLVSYYPKYKDIAKRVAEKSGITVSGADYIEWVEHAGYGDDAKFDKAVIKIVGQKAFDKAKAKNLAHEFMLWSIGLGPKVVKGCDFSTL